MPRLDGETFLFGTAMAAFSFNIPAPAIAERAKYRDDRKPGL
jgi:hypothetical protein